MLNQINLFLSENFGTENQKLNFHISKSASRLYSRLKFLDIKQIELTEYNERYFGDKIKNQTKVLRNLQLYSSILFNGLKNVDKPLKEITALDYGGGHGFLSLLMKESGIGTVIHSDIFAPSCTDAKKIADNLSLTADYYIPGDVDEVLKKFQLENLSCDLLCNHDVIEHVYDIDAFLKKLKNLSKGPLSIFLSTSANGENPLIRKQLMDQHLFFEYRDREYRYGRKPSDEQRALFEVRKELISKFEPRLSNEEINLLSKLSRGLLVRHIESVVKTYTTKNILPIEIDHPTNTCDPFTGNWFEHIMDPFELRDILLHNGFEVQVVPMYYTKARSLIRQIMANSLNYTIKISGKKGIFLSPGYALSGFKRY